MLDIQIKWLLILAANFFGLLFILNIILYRPLLRVFKERDDTVKGSLDAAKEMTARKEEGIEKMNREIADARHRAKEVFEGLRSEGMNTQKTALSEAEASAAETLAKARAELKAEMEKARGALRTDVERFSEEIVNKLVKAA